MLIVCEDPVIANLAGSMLQKQGYGLIGAVKSGQAAIYKTAQVVPDLVVMDVNIAGPMDPVDTSHYLLQIFHVPVLFIAGATDEAKLSRIKYAQPYGVVYRPFTASQILTGVDLALYAHADRLPLLGNLPLGDSRKMLDTNDEAVILLDKRGRVLLLNTYASWMVDLPLDKVVMRHWRDVMMFLSDATNEEVSDPVTNATRNLAGAIYDSSISLVTTTSKRRKVILKVRPVQDNHDRFIAAVLTLRENKKTYL